MRKPGTRSRRDGYNAGVKLKYILCLIIICCGIGGLSAQEPARDQASSEESSLLKAAAEFPTPEEVEARKKQTLESREIEEPTKKALIDLYDKILPQLSTLEKHQKEIDRYKKQKEQSPQLLSDIQKQLAQPVAEPKLDAEANLSLAQVENQKAQIEAEHKALVTQAMELEAEPKRRADRRAILPKEIAGAKERLEKLRSVPPKSLPDEKPSVFQARELLYRITEKVLGDEIQLYDAEMASYEARAELLTARRELISRNVSASEKLLNAWQNMATRRARMEAEKVSQEALKAQKEAIFSHPLIKQLAKDNVTLTNLLTGPDGLPARIEGLNRNLKVIEDELANRGNEYKSVKERVETIGHSGTIGLYLLTRKNGLPDVNQNKRNLKERIKLISATQYELLKHEDDWAELIGLDDEVDALSLKLESELNESQRESIRVEARKYLQTKRDNLKSIIEFYNTYFNKLIDLDVSEARLVALIEQYDRFVSEYIFWVKSFPELSRESFKNIPASLNWLGSPKNWLGTGKKLMQDFMDIFYVYVLVLLLLLLMLIKRNHFKKNLFDMSELLHQKYSDSYSYTQKALALTMLLAIVRPGLFLFISWRLTAVAGSDSFTTAVAMGCFSFSILFLGLEIVMCFMAPAGLVQAHFSVPSEAVRFLRWHTRWLLLLVLPLYFVLVSLMSQSEEIWQNSMGRLAFILIMLVVATYLFIIFRPAGLFIQKTLNDEKSWIYR
ncbi:MAG: hypothetical protein K9M57_04760, partial [Phycisphaerae bacterium]|nr:hypothetical protein [Phycisphaerae bacterium]